MGLMGPYKCSCVLIDSNGSLWVVINPYLFLWIPMGPMGSYRSESVLMYSNGSLWVL